MGNSNKCQAELEKSEYKYKKLSQMYLMSEKQRQKPLEKIKESVENDKLKQENFELKYDNASLINQDKLNLINKYNAIIKKKPSFSDLLLDINTYRELFSNKSNVRLFFQRLTLFSSVYLFDDPEIITKSSELYNHVDGKPDELLDIILMYIFSLDWGLVQ